MSICNVERVTYGVDDLEECRRFWLDFGLQEAVDAPGTFLAQDGTGVIIRDTNDPRLPAAIEPGPTMREVTYGVTNQAALDALATALAAVAPLDRQDDGSITTRDPLGFPLRLRVSERQPVQAPEPVFNTPGRPDRINTRGAFHKRVFPLELTHVVYMVDEPTAIVPFYLDVLGFRLSDSYPGRGYFMRGGSSRNHHNLFVLKADDKKAFHHVAFELGNIHELFGGGLNMTRKGWQTALGPGRHPISSCYFWYFTCPAGGAAEYDFDSDVVDDNWVAGEFEQTPDNFAEWCLAGGMQESLLFKGIQNSRTAGK